MRNRFFDAAVHLSASEAEALARPPGDLRVVEIHPPTGDVPATLPRFVQGVTEFQTKWFKLRNVSPVAAFEIIRPRPDTLRFQFVVPTKRLERKVRTHLTESLPDVGFSDGSGGLPVQVDGDTAGGGILSPGRRDWYPLRPSFDRPPMNHVAAALHRHGMQDTRFHIQILFQPVAGRPVWRWWRNRRAFQRIGYLRKEKQKLWGNRAPTPRERSQADAIEEKAGTTQFHTVIRFAVFLPNYEEMLAETVKSRVKEVSGAFNVYEDPETGQYLNTHTIQALRRSSLTEFFDSLHQRRLDDQGHPFHASSRELAALVSLPNQRQDNITHSQP